MFNAETRRVASLHRSGCDWYQRNQRLQKSVNFGLCDTERRQQPEAVCRQRHGAQRYRCTTCRRTFQMHYRHKVHEPGTRARVLDLALNGSGIRDIACVLRISPQTVLSELKKKSRP